MSAAPSKGLFITFEGTEGSGKSTQITLLAKRLEQQGRKIHVTREPGGTPLGEEIRHLIKHGAASNEMAAMTELMLVNASRTQLVHEVVHPALMQNQVVLCDRFYDSTVAYQGYGRQLPLDMVRQAITLAVGTIQPHLTVLLQVPLATSEERQRRRKAGEASPRDRIEEEDRAFFQRVEKGFLAIAAAEPDRVKKVDGTKPPEEVSLAVWKLVEPLLGR